LVSVSRIEGVKDSKMFIEKTLILENPIILYEFKNVQNYWAIYKIKLID
jgi:hypothetical protein